MFPEIRDFVYPNYAGAYVHVEDIRQHFLNKGSLGVDEYYEMMYIVDVPEDAHWYFWPDQSYFLFGRDEQGYHVKALDPIKVNDDIEEDENEQSGN